MKTNYVKEINIKMGYKKSTLRICLISFLLFSANAWVLRFNNEEQSDSSDGKYKLKIICNRQVPGI